MDLGLAQIQRGKAFFPMLDATASNPQSVDEFSKDYFKI